MDSVPSEIFYDIIKNLPLQDAILLQKAGGLPAHLSAELRDHIQELIAAACVDEARDRVDAMLRAMKASRARASRS